MLNISKTLPSFFLAKYLNLFKYFIGESLETESFESIAPVSFVRFAFPSAPPSSVSCPSEGNSLSGHPKEVCLEGEGVITPSCFSDMKWPLRIAVE